MSHSDLACRLKTEYWIRYCIRLITLICLDNDYIHFHYSSSKLAERRTPSTPQAILSYEGKVQLSLCSTNHTLCHEDILVMDVYEWDDSHFFFTSVLFGGELSASFPCSLNP
jgi:hypothetical protein